MSSEKSKETPQIPVFNIELEDRTVELKKGTHKLDMLNILGIHRAVEISNYLEIWYYRFSVNSKILYCVLMFEKGELQNVKTTIRNL